MHKHRQVSSLLAPEVYEQIKASRDADEMTNEIESQCPQMIVLFETSQACTDEDASHFPCNKSEESINDNSNELLNGDNPSNYEDKIPPNIKSISKLSRNNPQYQIPTKAVSLNSSRPRNHERSFLSKLKSSANKRIRRLVTQTDSHKLD